MYAGIAALVRRTGEVHARRLALHFFQAAAGLAMLAARRPAPMPGTGAMGLSFSSPLGLAAGFDRTGKLVRAADALGFGCIEIGTAAPHPEQGRPGIHAVLAQLAREAPSRPLRIRVGVNIGANSATTASESINDYLACLRDAWGRADYLVLNLSAASTATLRDSPLLLPRFLMRLKQERERLAVQSGRRMPVAIKLAVPPPAALPPAVRWAAALDFDGLVLVHHPAGGKAAQTIERVIAETENRLDIISVGGIDTPQEAQARLEAGAALVQVFTSVVEQGPFIARKINRHLAASRVKPTGAGAAIGPRGG